MFVIAGTKNYKNIVTVVVILLTDDSVSKIIAMPATKKNICIESTQVNSRVTLRKRSIHQQLDYKAKLRNTRRTKMQANINVKSRAHALHLFYFY